MRTSFRSTDKGGSGGSLPFVRALAAFLALPGIVAFAAPIAMGLSSGSALRYIGVAATLLIGGSGLLLWCVREFYVRGRGTLAPWAPPQWLVTSGPYRLTRNPMYLAVLVILLGWSALWGSRALLLYALAVHVATHLRVRLFEEPWAAQRFGAEWEAYRARVPRWLL